MSGSMRTVRLSWPRDVSLAQIHGVVRLLASTAGTPVVLEAIGSYHRVEHRLRLPEGKASIMLEHLRAALPGIGIEPTENNLPTFAQAVNLRLSTRRRPLDGARAEETSRSILTALANVGSNECVILSWILTDRLAAVAVPSKLTSLPDESLTRALFRAPFGAARPADAETRSAMRDKQGETGWRVIGRIAVKAVSASRRQQILSSVLGAMRTTESAGVRIEGRTTSTRSISDVGGHGRIRLNTTELSALCAWPVGLTNGLPVTRLGSRRLQSPAEIPTAGRSIGESTWPGSTRRLAISPEDSLRHLHVIGPTGTGKSTLLLNLITSDIAAGAGVVVVDPKGDLIADVLSRIPASRRSDVVLLDPTDNESPVGLNPLAEAHGSPDLVADQLLEVFHGLYAANWGPRTQDILGAALLSLARVGGMSLACVPLLLTDQAFRRKIIGQLHDPIGLEPFWASYEAWSDAERTTAIAPVLNKLRPFLMRTNLRRLISQQTPRFTVKQVFTERKILLVDLAKGRIGGEAAALLGAIVMAQLWQASLERSGIDAAKRRPVNVYLDEFQDYLHLPTNLSDALAQARGLGVGFTLAHQHLAQLSSTMKSAVLSNARSRICFQLGAEDARLMGTTANQLDSADFSELDAFNFYAQLVADNKVQRWCSGRSLPPGKQTSDPAEIREISRTRYGTPSDEIDNAIIKLMTMGTPVVGNADDLSPRRRFGGRS